MEVVIQKDTSLKIEKVAQVLGVGKQKIVDRALILYLDTISKQLDLKKEMKEWDALSDEALNIFDKSV